MYRLPHYSNTFWSLLLIPYSAAVFVPTSLHSNHSCRTDNAISAFSTFGTKRNKIVFVPCSFSAAVFAPTARSAV